MSNSDLNMLIKQNEKIMSQNKILMEQNDEIIDLIKKAFSLEDETEIIDNEDSVFNCELGVGEVLTVASSANNELCIYKINVSHSNQLNVNPVSLENHVIKYLTDFDNMNFNVSVDNLTGYDSTVMFNVPFIIAIESLNRNIPIPSGVCFAVTSKATLARNIFVPTPQVAVIPVFSKTASRSISTNSLADLLYNPT